MAKLVDEASGADYPIRAALGLIAAASAAEPQARYHRRRR
jgi:hypothetical protein